jgi:membrane dipeptidase
MKLTFFLFFTSFVFSQAQSQSYQKIHADAVVCDTHNDIISTCVEKGYLFDHDLTGKTHSDLKRMLKGGLDVQVFSIFCDGKEKSPFRFANR